MGESRLEPAPGDGPPLGESCSFRRGSCKDFFLTKKLRTLEALNKDSWGLRLASPLWNAECCWKGSGARAQGEARRPRPRHGEAEQGLTVEQAPGQALTSGPVSAEPAN